MIDIVAALDCISEILEKKGLMDEALSVDKVADTLEYLSDEVNYGVKEAAKKKKVFQKMDIEKGSLHKSMGIPEDETIPMEKINKKITSLHNKKEKDGKLSAEDSKMLKRLNLAKTFKGLKKKED